MKSWRNPGWKGESYRHYLAAKGVRTGSTSYNAMKFYARPYSAVQVKSLVTSEGKVYIVVPGNDPNYIALPSSSERTGYGRFGDQGAEIKSDAKSMTEENVQRFTVRDKNGKAITEGSNIVYAQRVFKVIGVTANDERVTVQLINDGGLRAGASPDQIEVRGE